MDWPAFFLFIADIQIFEIKVYHICNVLKLLKQQQYHTDILKYVQWPLLLTWFNFNPSMDK